MAKSFLRVDVSKAEIFARTVLTEKALILKTRQNMQHLMRRLNAGLQQGSNASCWTVVTHWFIGVP
jgi:hypothetical protein